MTETEIKEAARQDALRAKAKLVLIALNPFSSSGNVVVDVLYATTLVVAIAVVVELAVYLA